MNLCSRIILAALFLMATATADVSSSTVALGHYVRSGDSGTLIIRKGEQGQRRFEIESIGGNCHLCAVSGEIRGRLGLADGWSSDSREEKCRITFDHGSGGVNIQPTDEVACRSYCGMRASFEGLYKTPPPFCTMKSQQKRRNDFLKRYRSRDFKKAGAELESLLSQCAEYMNWIAIDSVRNDLAISQFHSGDFPGCLKTLAATRAARYSNEEMLVDQMPMCDRDNYLDVAKAAWHNKALCEKGGDPK